MMMTVKKYQDGLFSKSMFYINTLSYDQQIQRTNCFNTILRTLLLAIASMD